MINIRYHIVSITAIFLALGIGTLLGSTFLDRATVDQLDRNIRNAEERIDDIKADNDRLELEVERSKERDRALIEASDTLLDGQLTEQPVLLVLAPGVDQATVDVLRRILVAADADLRGSLALRDDLATADGIDTDLAEALGVDPEDPEAARQEALDQLVEVLRSAGQAADPDDGETPEVGTTTTPEDGSDGDEDDPAPEGQPDIVTALAEADLVGIDPGPSARPDDPVLERPGYRYVYVSQPGLDPEADALLLDLLPADQIAPPLPAVVVSVTVPDVAEDEDEEELPPTAVGLVRQDPVRSELYDTVDDIDTYMGLSSTVTVLRTSDTAGVGHYGEGEGITAMAPSGR